MRRTLKVLSALLTYPSAELQKAVPEMRAAVEAEGVLPQTHRRWLDRTLDEIATGDLFELQERYVLLFDRTRSLSLHLFEHVHGESRDRGQAMVDLKALYEQHGLAMCRGELPDHLPLFLEFLSEIPAAEARELIEETSHVLEAIRLRLEKRKVSYASIFSSAQALAHACPHSDALAALDAAWEEEEVTFGPGSVAAAQCGKDGIAAKVRAARRPAPGMPASQPKRPVVTYSQVKRV